MPLRDEDYRRLRPTLALAERNLIYLSDNTALNCAAGAFERLFKDGKLAVVQNAGCAKQSPSHYRSTEIWQTASEVGDVIYAGWGGQCISHLESQGRVVSSSYAGAVSPRVFARENRPLAPAYCAGHDFTEALGFLGERAATTAGPEIHFVSAPGFDTHFRQGDVHAERLHAVSKSLAAFQQRLDQRGVAPRVLTVAFSEFGRSVAENSQGGTDHGGPAPVFLLGPQLAGGLHNEGTGLCDFRRIVRSVATDWLGVPWSAVFARDPGEAGFLRLPTAT